MWSIKQTFHSVALNPLHRGYIKYVVFIVEYRVLCRSLFKTVSIIFYTNAQLFKTKMIILLYSLIWSYGSWIKFLLYKNLSKSNVSRQRFYCIRQGTFKMTWKPCKHVYKSIHNFLSDDCMRAEQPTKSFELLLMLRPMVGIP